MFGSRIGVGTFGRWAPTHHLATLPAYEYGQSLYLTNLAKELFGSARAAGLGRSDFAALHGYLERKSL